MKWVNESHSRIFVSLYAYAFDLDRLAVYCILQLAGRSLKCTFDDGSSSKLTFRILGRAESGERSAYKYQITISTIKMETCVDVEEGAASPLQLIAQRPATMPHHFNWNRSGKSIF